MGGSLFIVAVVLVTLKFWMVPLNHSSSRKYSPKYSVWLVCTVKLVNFSELVYNEKLITLRGAIDPYKICDEVKLKVMLSIYR